MKHFFYFFSCIFLFLSCSKSIDDDSLDIWVRANDSEKIFSKLYNRQKIDKKKFTEIVLKYSEAINEKKLIAKPIKNDNYANQFMKRERLGYEYFDEKGNLHYSITYKTLSVDADSTMNFNFIDFRSTDFDLPCIKIPSFMMIRCIYTPVIPNYNTQSFYDSLEQIGPIELEGRKYFHYDLLKRKKKFIPEEQRKGTLVFNIHNQYVRSHIDIITKDLENEIDLDSFDLAYIEGISTPKLRIGYNFGADPKQFVKILDYFESRLKDQLVLVPISEKKFVPMKGDIVIGHTYEDRRKIRIR